jgi:DNA-binding MarR family transcriptional regulator
MFDEPVIELLLYIYRNGGEIENFRATMMKLGYSSAKLDRARRVLLEYNLIKQETVKGAPVVLRIIMTEKGKMVARKIIELKKLLEES